MERNFVEELKERIYLFYPGLAGEMGRIIFSLGDYSIDNIYRFIDMLREYKSALSRNYDTYFLVIKQLDFLTEELANTYNSKLYFYYGRGFLTLFESLNTTNVQQANERLFEDRLQYIESIVSQAERNLDSELMSKVEILDTKRLFLEICEKIEKSAPAAINQRYYFAKLKFTNLICRKLDEVRTIVPRIDRNQFGHWIKENSDHIFGIDIIEEEAYELLEFLRIKMVGSYNDRIMSPPIKMTTEYIDSLVQMIIDAFSVEAGLIKRLNLLDVEIVESHSKQLTLDYRALISFTDNGKVIVYINIDHVKTENELIYTLIHEVFPGHYFMSKFYSDETNKFFKEKSFWEGWAVFCEFYSLCKIERSLYQVELSTRLLNGVLIGLICIKIWYHRQSKSAIIEWLHKDIRLSKQEGESLLLTALTQYEDRLPYFVGFITMYLMYKKIGFDYLIDLVMQKGASFYHIKKYVYEV